MFYVTPKFNPAALRYFIPFLVFFFAVQLQAQTGTEEKALAINAFRQA